MYIDIDLSDADEEELKEELESRGFRVVSIEDIDEEDADHPLLNAIFEKYRLGPASGRAQSYDAELRELFWSKLGRMA